LALAFVLLSVVQFMGRCIPNADQVREGYGVLFHTFHYLHIVVAVTGAVVMFFRFSRKWVSGILVALLVPTVFCILSDIVLPSVAVRLLGISMEMHICFCEWHDGANLIAFMLIGLLCGLALLQNRSSLYVFSLASHFMHILASSMAAVFYAVAHGFDRWYEVPGILFVLLFIAVVIPCTLSDVVVPLYVARMRGGK
jgi:uncharacterized membrane protein YhdT